MDKSGLMITFAPKNTRRLFFQWAAKWYYANLPENVSNQYFSTYFKILTLLDTYVMIFFSSYTRLKALKICI